MQKKNCNQKLAVTKIERKKTHTNLEKKTNFLKKKNQNTF